MRERFSYTPARYFQSSHFIRTNKQQRNRKERHDPGRQKPLYLFEKTSAILIFYCNLGNKFISGLSYRSSPMKMNIITYFSTIAGENYNNSLFIRKKT